MRNKIVILFAMLILILMTTNISWGVQPFEYDVGNRIVEKVFKTTNPTVTDDKEFRVGTVWINKTTDKAYILTDNAGGAAVWKDFSLADVDGNVDINGGTIDGVSIGSTVPATVVVTDEVQLDDTNSTHQLSLIWNEDDVADRLINILVGGGDRNFTLNENLTIGNGTDITITGEDNASTITLDNSTLEVENAAATQRLLKLVIGTDAAATLSIEGTSGAINQDVTSDASPSFTNLTATAATPTELITWTDAGWNETGDWTFAASTLTHITGNTTAVTGTVTGALTIGTTYAVRFVGTGGVATATYTLGGCTGTTIPAAGAIDFTDYITATVDSELVITPANTCTVALTLVSVKALTDATGDLVTQGNLTVGSPATFYSPVLLSYGIATTPSLSFSGDTDTGIFSSGGNSFNFTFAGGRQINFSSSGIQFYNDSVRLILYDTYLYRDGAANSLAQRNSTNTQTFRLYTTYVSGTSYERLGINTAAGSITLAAETLDAGTDNIDIILTPAGTGKVSSSKEIVGTNYKTIYIPAASMTATATNGAVLGTYEYATNDINADFYAFDGATEQFVECEFPMPEDWNLGTIKAKAYWSSATGSTAGDTCEWEIQGGAQSNDDAIDAALGTAQVVSDVLLADNGADRQLTAATPAITIGGTPALADMIHWKISRNVGGTDDMTEKGWLFGFYIQYLANTSVATW